MVGSMSVARSLALFALAALAEIDGAWLIWQGVREHRGVAFVGAGVAANSLLRDRLMQAGKQLGVEVLLPARELTTDNAAMIARAGQVGWARGEAQDPRRFDARSSEKWQPPGMR